MNGDESHNDKNNDLEACLQIRSDQEKSHSTMKLLCLAVFFAILSLIFTFFRGREVVWRRPHGSCISINTFKGKLVCYHSSAACRLTCSESLTIQVRTVLVMSSLADSLFNHLCLIFLLYFLYFLVDACLGPVLLPATLTQYFIASKHQLQHVSTCKAGRRSQRKATWKLLLRNLFRIVSIFQLQASHPASCVSVSAS